MENVTHYDSRADWLSGRNGKIGSSEIGTIAGLNPYKSPLRLWTEWTGKSQPEQENKAMIYGSLVEDAIAQLVQIDHPNWAIDRHPYRTFSHSENERFIATPDGIIVREDESKEILEIKHSAAFSQWENEEIPDSYACQLHWQMGIVGLQGAVLYAIVGGRALQPVEREVKFESDVFDQLTELATKFLDLVDRDIPPESGPNDSKLIDSLVHREKGKVFSFSAEHESLLDEYNRVQNRLRDVEGEAKMLKDKKTSISNELKLIMGDSTVGQFTSGATVSLSEVNRNGYYVEPTSYWQMRVKTK